MAMSTCYSTYQYNICPIGYTEWNPIIPVVNPVYTVPVPVLMNPAPVLATAMCPYVAPAIPPVLTPVLSNHTSPCYYESFSELQSPIGSFHENDTFLKTLEDEDPMMYYLRLPKDLFPSPRMMALDPNELIDEFCRLPNVYKQVPWILDLEFGVPKSPITRPIPFYNVKLNSINCKNTPDAIHPGFERCSEDFKRVLLFFYDSIVSAWYRSYVFVTYDISVENFQCWLMLPMQELGMCWS